MLNFRITPEQRLFTGFSILFVVTVIIYIAAYWTIENLIRADRFVNATYKYRSRVLSNRSLLKDAQTGARGYVLTGKPNYLKPYSDAFSEIPPAINRLHEWARSNPHSAVPSDEIERLTELELRQLKTLIELKANNAPQADLEAALESERATMDQLRKLVAPIDQSTLASLKDYMERAEEQNMFAHGLLPTLGIAVLALFIVVFRQVTAQVQAQRLLLKSEKELTVARDKALDASRLKSEFVANISHELRTPLSGILGMAELLTLKPLDHESIDISNHLLDSAKHLLTVVNDLLDFSKLEAGKVNLEVMTVSLRDLVNDVIKNSSPEARKKGLQLSEQVSHAVPKEIVADATRIKQVLLNMLHNAIKFTKIGSVQLDVSMTEEGMIKFSVTDTGIGVSRLIQDKLFQPFVQGDGSTTRVYGGTGLGLSVSRNLVQLMDGKIGVISVEGSGSTFWFSIPVLLPEQVTVMADLNTPAGKKDEDASAMEQPSEQAQESSATDISDPVDTVATEIANRLEPARGSGYEQAAETTESTKNPTSQPHEQTNVR